MSLRDQVAHLSQGTQGMSKEEVLADWSFAIDALLDKIEAVVQPLVDENFLSVERSWAVVHEGWIGAYRVMQMEMRSGPKTIRITPVARMVAGSTGRVDIAGTSNGLSSRLVRRETGDNSVWYCLSARSKNQLIPEALPVLFRPDEEVSSDFELLEATDKRIEALLERLFIF